MAKTIQVDAPSVWYCPSSGFALEQICCCCCCTAETEAAVRFYCIDRLRPRICIKICSESLIAPPDGQILAKLYCLLPYTLWAAFEAGQDASLVWNVLM